MFFIEFPPFDIGKNHIRFTFTWPFNLEWSEKDPFSLHYFVSEEHFPSTLVRSSLATKV